MTVVANLTFDRFELCLEPLGPVRHFEGADLVGGFRVYGAYVDGAGKDEYGNEYRGQALPLTHEMLGVTPTFERTEQLGEWLFSEANMAAYEAELEAQQAVLHRYRRKFIDDYDRKQVALSYAFMPELFLRPAAHKTAAAIRETLARNEKSFSVEDEDLVALESRAAVFFASGAHSYWVTFWHDLYANNRRLPVVRKRRAMFDPALASSLAWNPVGRRDLEEKLLRANIFDEDFLGQHVLDTLYLNMEHLDVQRQAVAMLPKPPKK